MKRILSVLMLCASPALACEDYHEAVAAVQGDDPELAAELYERVVVDPFCNDALREWMGTYLARNSFAVSLGNASAGVKKAALEQALGYEIHWRSYAALGRIAWAEGAYEEAALHFQKALNELAEGDQTHDASTDEIAQIYQLATAALSLSDQVVALPVTRAGTPPAMLTGKIRGFEVEEVPLPITFEYNSTTFDEAGLSYANALVNHLLQTAPPSVNLGGHTDPVGGEDFNMDLSAQRAEALASYLRAAGYEGEIITTAYGESRLPPAPPGITPGSEEHHRIARRVSFAAQ